MKKLEVRLAETALLPPEARLAKASLGLSSGHGAVAVGDCKAREVQITHSELGILIGPSREFVTRILSRFKERGWVSTNGRTIVVQTRTVLMSLSGSLT